MMSDESDRLVRIETKLDILLSSDKDKEERLRALERRNAYVIGVCAVVSFIAPFVIKKLFGV